MRNVLFLVATFVGVFACGGAVDAAAPIALRWENRTQVYSAQPGETGKTFTFRFENTSAEDVVIVKVVASCGCTSVNIPQLPWRVASGERASFDVVVDFEGKNGVMHRMFDVWIQGEDVATLLTLKITVPENLSEQRLQAIEIARRNRQGLFQNDCAACHAKPAAGKQGKALYAAACAVCHESVHRASMVPPLRFPNGQFRPQLEKELIILITHGREATLMPAFSEAHGGPLDQRQIASIAEYTQGGRITPASELAASARSAGGIAALEFSALSGEQLHVLNAGGEGAFVIYVINVSHEGNYRVKVRFRKMDSYGRYQLKIDDASQGELLDGYFRSRKPALEEIDFGSKTLAAGVHTLRFECVGKNPRATGFGLGVHYIKLTE